MSEKILLVDDEENFLEIMSERMRSRGMEVTTTTSAAEALQKVEEESFDAVVLDLIMPEMNGLEVLKAIKEKRPELEVILLTGYPTVEKAIEAGNYGALDFIEKPAELKEITKKIRQARFRKVILMGKQAGERIDEVQSKAGKWFGGLFAKDKS